MGSCTYQWTCPPLHPSFQRGDGERRREQRPQHRPLRPALIFHVRGVAPLARRPGRSGRARVLFPLPVVCVYCPKALDPNTAKQPSWAVQPSHVGVGPSLSDVNDIDSQYLTRCRSYSGSVCRSGRRSLTVEIQSADNDVVG